MIPGRVWLDDKRIFIACFLRLRYRSLDKNIGETREIVNRMREFKGKETRVERWMKFLSGIVVVDNFILPCLVIYERLRV